MGAASTAGGMLCCNNEDWFSIDVSPGDRLTATLCYDLPSGDLNVALYHADGTEILSSTTGGADHIAWIAPSSETVTVAVTGVPGAGNDYVLWLTQGVYSCADDAYEDNDVYASPTWIEL